MVDLVDFAVPANAQAADPFRPTGRSTAKGSCDRTTGAVFRGTESLLTLRWRVEGDGFELPVPPGIGGSPSWWSRTRKPYGAPERGFIDGGTNSSNPPPSSGESANHRFLSSGAYR